MVRVSVVLTTYNRPERLAAAVASVRSQTFSSWELIIVDDASPCDYGPALAKLGVPHIYHRHEKNRRVSAARNTGVKLAQGEFVAFLDDDDQWLPQKLERQLAKIGLASLCLCGRQFVGSDLTVLHHDVEEISQSMLKHRNNFCGASGILARRDALLLNPFDESLVCSEDWELYYRFAQLGNIPYVAEALYLFNDGQHDRMTNAPLRVSHSEILRRLEPISKHRASLGEASYRRKVAGTLLAYIADRPNKVRILRMTLRYAGWLATLSYLWTKLWYRNRPVVMEW
ncbi:glycosyltransferase family 2 protein [Ferrimonas gelatinilytica]|uniref:Glycosyltransferase 2-like domain-containing protein n=1 Tax=Ferrimonas gelatinilytica TaxID=1255257 RepID=A0ABP9SAZ2_9GAMM